MSRTTILAIIASLSAATVAMAFFGADTLKVRTLDDIATIGVPKKMKEEWYKDDRERWIDRLTFQFVSTATWESFGSTSYKQALTVTLISPHAADSSYEHVWNSIHISYKDRSVVHDAALGTGHLKVTKAIYEKNDKTAYEYIYVDKSRRLRLDWHAMEREVKLADGMKAIAGMASSFTLLKDPAERFARLHDRPNREAKEAQRRVALATSMLAREGFKDLMPGKPQQKGELYVEWMAEPEHRYQLLVPLGRIRAASPEGGRAPLPLTLRNADGTERYLAGSIGWYAKTSDG
ncbi:MAG: hypothetical protein JNL26_08515, partial [Gemmatimonadetes bacterium]|nr:hypothetical protein [Gemmatimonadota bacterium]